MKTGLSIGIHIEERLRASEALQGKISGRVFPIAAVSGTQKPYICYTRTGITPDYTKDGWAGDTVNVAIEIVADGYKSAVELAELVREQLEDSTAEYGEWEVRDCELMRAVDGYALELDAYLISLEFSFKTY